MSTYALVNAGSKLGIVSYFTAPLVDFVQVDVNSSMFWGGRRFCPDKELYLVDANNDKKYAR